MKKTLIILSLIFIKSSINAQWLGNYWTADDMNGVTHTIQDDLNDNKAVLVDISAHWCGPCFSLHQSHSMAGVYHDFGPVNSIIHRIKNYLICWIKVSKTFSALS